MHARAARPARGIGDGAPVAKTAGVMEEMAQGDGLAVVGQLGDVLVDGVVELELARLGQKHDGGGGELLGHGPRLEDRLRGIGDAMLEVGRSVGAAQDLLAVLADAHGAAGRVGRVAREDRVHARGGIARRGVGGTRARRETDQGEERQHGSRDRAHAHRSCHSLLGDSQTTDLSPLACGSMSCSLSRCNGVSGSRWQRYRTVAFLPASTSRGSQRMR